METLYGGQAVLWFSGCLVWLVFTVNTNYDTLLLSAVYINP